MEYYKNLSLKNIVYKNDEGIECIEQWKDVFEFEGLYQVSDLGRVKSLSRMTRFGSVNFLKKEIIRKQFVKKSGYLCVDFCKNNIIKKNHVHRLVANCFIINKEGKSQVNHINGVKADNRANYLEWSTCSENILHSYHTGLHKSGQNASFSKLSEIEILSIRENKNNLSYRDLSLLHKVSKSNIGQIMIKKTWAHI